MVMKQKIDNHNYIATSRKRIWMR